MKYIYLDESGDLGLDLNKANVSRHFLCTAVVTEKPTELQHIVRKTVSNLCKSKLRPQSGTLHATEERSITVKRVLKRVARKNVQIAVVYIDKTSMQTKLANLNYHQLYINLTSELISGLKLNEEAELIASQRETSRSLNTNFVNKLEVQFPNVKAVIKKPQVEKALQIADFVSWSLFRKYEKQDAEYYEIFKDSILLERKISAK